MKKKILVVDDEHSVTSFLKAYLEETGRYEIRAENSGERGFEAAKSFQPDLMLLDIMMNDMSGDRLADKAKNDPLVRKIPIIFMTGIVTQQEVEISGGLIGGYPYIAKPILSMKLLLDCIEKYIR